MITVKNTCSCGNLIVMYFILFKAFPHFSLIDLPLLYNNMITRGHAVAQAVIGE